MASVQANGITVEYEEQGAGEPILLVMGLSGQLTDWPQGLVDAIAAHGFRVIRFDNRDAGLSTAFTSAPPTIKQLGKAVALRRKLASEYVIPDMAADAVGLLDALEIERAHVVGMSMGGMIAQAIAIDHPARALSLTSIMSTTGNSKVGRPKMRVVRNTVRRPRSDRSTAVATAIAQFRDISGPTFDEVEFAIGAQQSIDRSWRPDGTARQLAAIIASSDRTEGLRRLDLPTLVIHGLVDPLVQPSGGIATAQAVPGARLLMFPDMGHDLPRSRWHDIASAIADNARRAATTTTG